jgi:YVTN family beta-propeller protein
MRRPVFLLCLSCLIIFNCGFMCGPASTSNFTIQTEDTIGPMAGTGDGPAISIPRPYTLVDGSYVFGSAGPNEIGSEAGYEGTTNTLGLFTANDVILPANWNHTVNFGYAPLNPAEPCLFPLVLPSQNIIPLQNGLYETLDVPMTNGNLFTWGCYYEDSQLPEGQFQFALQNAPPTSLTIPSNGLLLSTSHGYPQLNIYQNSLNGNSLVNTVTASSISPDQKSAIFTFPHNSNGSALAPNLYTAALMNKNSDGSLSPAGPSLLSIASSQTIAGNPFGIAVAGQTDSWEDRDSCDRGSSSGTSYSSVPIISLYSLGQVLVNGTAVMVGVNPTAVATYSGRNVQTSSSDDCDSYRDSVSGQTQAVVANSGTNTISILDIVNNAVLSTVTVGHQPVALAISSDGSTAYVANYADSSVTKVSLLTATAITTIPLVGKPTSVTLSAAGTLWVGGVGFLTELNPQTMTTVATQTMSNKTIVAISFSDLANKLAATSVDTTGNVYSDGISSSNFSSSTVYAPQSSLKISSVGLHLNSQTHAQVDSFSATLASTTTINVNQIGAPPLVVQDGWAVITATPTGFTLSDITNNAVLVSEPTATPVTAIAVDPNLSVAYLALPDSNTVLIVPLPN